MDTKEKILITALHLFAKDGYEAVSVSRITGKLGITKGALYRHYESKRAIFDSLVERMFQIDEERAKQYSMPEHSYEKDAEEYGRISVEHVKKFTLAQLRFWTEDDFASNFRKMLALEQYRNEQMGKLYSDCIVAGPVSYMEDVFREMMKRKILKDANANLLAVEFYAPLFLWIQIYDRDDDEKTIQELLQAHMEKFFQTYRRG